jgi:hypothetical protein
MKRLILMAARLYPAWWRRRYGAEFDALLQEMQPTWREVVDVFRGALIMHVKNLALVPVLCGVAGVIAGGIVALRTPGLFASSATLRLAAGEDAQGARRERLAAEELRAVLDRAVDEADGATALTLLTLRNVDAASSVVRVTYMDPDPGRAQHVARAVSEALAAKDVGRGVSSELLVAADRPQAPITPEYATHAASGGGIGLTVGTLVFLVLRSRRG